MKVSVVVPVYNPGVHIEQCIESLVKQSLPDEDYEVIFVDDGSTDATPARLAEAAAAHANVSVVHTPNSGWPGRPRNIGIDRAQGEYVYFVDHDDWLGEEALERLYDYATANGSDVVIGKMAGHGRGIPRELFLHNRPDARLDADPLLSILTPHKLFRRALLDEHGIRFLEGRRRLEDHLFVLQAYFSARRISVLADYVCWHWYRGKMLGTLSGRSLLATPGPQRAVLFREVRELAAERFGPAVPAGLGALNRVRAALLEADRLDLLVLLAQWETGLQARGQLQSSRWRAGVLVLRYTAALVDSSGKPVAFDLQGETPHWRLPEVIRDSGMVPDAATSVPGVLPGPKISLLVRSADTGAEFVLPGRTRWPGRTGSQRLMRFIGESHLDPATAAGGAAIEPGQWFLQVSIRTGGLTRNRYLPGADGSPRLSLVIDPDRPTDSVDPRFISGQAKRSWLSLNPVLFDPRFQRLESMLRRRSRPLTCGIRRLLRRGARATIRT